MKIFLSVMVTALLSTGLIKDSVATVGPVADNVQFFEFVSVFGRVRFAPVHR